MYKADGLAYYGEAFATAGYATVAFDYRRWGESGRRATQYPR